jgi:tetratricopeptide (TPR) repeat protein
MGNNYSKANSSYDAGILGISDFQKSGKTVHLDLAIGQLRKAVKIAPPDHKKRTLFLIQLGNWVGFRYDETGRPEDLIEAVQRCEEAVTVACPGHEDRVICLITLGDVLLKRYRKDESPADLDRAEQIYREAVSLAPQGHEYRMTSLASFGDFLEAKFQKTKVLDDIHEAIRYCQEAEKAASADGSEGWPLNSLSTCLLAKYQMTKTATDLNEATRAARRAIEHNSGGVDADIPLNDLTRCLAAKFERSQALKDIDEAIQTAMRACEEAKPIRHKWKTSLLLLGEQYDTKYKKTGAKMDLNNCFTFHREMANFFELRDPARIDSLHRLCILLYAKYKSTKDLKDLTDAIQFGREALTSMDLWAPDHTGHTRLLDLMSTCFATKSAETLDPGDLKVAISSGEKAIEAMSEDDPLREEAVKKVKDLKVNGSYKEPK